MQYMWHAKEYATLGFARIIKTSGPKSAEVVTGLAGQGRLCEVLRLSSCDSRIIYRMRGVSH